MVLSKWMAELAFYQLRTSSLEEALCTLLQKALDSNYRVLVIGDSDERVSSLSLALWTRNAASFLAHGTINDDNCEDQPILLITEQQDKSENINSADVAIAIDGTVLNFIDGVSRYLDVFDGNNEIARDKARNRWMNYKNDDHLLTFWKQGDDGAWSKQK